MTHIITPTPRKILLTLVLTIAATYVQVAGFDFVNFDDPDYVTANFQHGICWALTSGEAANWFPLTRMSHMLDVQVFGLRAGPHHLMNVLLHAIAAMLLFLFLNRATRATWPSAFVAFVFALHPLHVESVAWIAERKDVLNAVFWFLTLWCYVRYTERPGRGRYLMVVAAFCCGLMSKPMIVTLPFVLLLLDYWPLQRKMNWREKLPLFTLSALAAAITFFVQRNAGAVQPLSAHPLPLRIENALVTYVIYIFRTFWPVNLAVFYPYPSGFPAWQVVGAALVVLAISVAAWRLRGPFAVGWLWFFGTLIPVIGLVQVGGQARADRYMYVPMVGLTIMLAWGLPRARALAIAACVACAVVSWVQIGYWRNSGTLFAHAIAVTGPDYLAEHNLGTYLTDQPGRLPEAVEHLKTALQREPDSVKARNDLGNALAKMPGHLPDAIHEYQTALQGEPNSPIPQHNMMLATAQLAEEHYNKGVSLTKGGKLQEAAKEFQAALQNKPDYAEAHNDLGVTLAQIPGRSAEALEHFRAAVRIRPDYADAKYNLQIALSQQR